MGNALAVRGDEGRVRLRKVTTSCQRALTRKCPNGATRTGNAVQPFMAVNPGK